MWIKWIIIAIGTLLYMFMLHNAGRKSMKNWYTMGIEALFYRMMYTICYAIFWIIFLIIF